jgi:hypothetical protein
LTGRAKPKCAFAHFDWRPAFSIRQFWRTELAVRASRSKFTISGEDSVGLRIYFNPFQF